MRVRQSERTWRSVPRGQLTRRDFVKGAAAFIVGGLSCGGLGAPPFGSRPNVLFVMTDQQRFPYMGAYGTISVRTPAMDSIAARGALFTHAFCSTPQCSASR